MNTAVSLVGFIFHSCFYVREFRTVSSSFIQFIYDLRQVQLRVGEEDVRRRLTRVPSRHLPGLTKKLHKDTGLFGSFTGPYYCQTNVPFFLNAPIIGVALCRYISLRVNTESLTCTEYSCKSVPTCASAPHRFHICRNWHDFNSQSLSIHQLENQREVIQHIIGGTTRFVYY